MKSIFSELKFYFDRNRWEELLDKIESLNSESSLGLDKEIKSLKARFTNIRRHQNNNLLPEDELFVIASDFADRLILLMRKTEEAYCKVHPSPILDQQVETRISIAIGCGEYLNHNLLLNPINDAEDVNQKLGKLHFDSEVVRNPSLVEFQNELDTFLNSTKDYKVRLFYFAGHGVQVNGVNYLIPIDAKLETPKDTLTSCISLNEIVERLSKKSNCVNIIIVDACRGNPFERTWRRNILSRGLAAMDAPSGTIIAYATSPGKTASDGKGRNGTYTKHLLKNMDRPDISIGQMFQFVRQGVINETNERQLPWETTSLLGDFYFTRD